MGNYFKNINEYKNYKKLVCIDFVPFFGLRTPTWGVFFAENFTDYSFKTKFTTFPSKVCINLCTYDTINEVTPPINRQHPSFFINFF